MQYHSSLSFIPDSTIALYYIFVALGALYILVRFGIGKTTLLIVLIFWEGLFDYYSEMLGFSPNIYKIVITFYAVILFGPNIYNKKNRNDLVINVTFIFFSLSYLFTHLFNSESLITIFSQYSYKYSIPFLIYHGIKDICYNTDKRVFLTRFLYHILFIQVAFSVIKMLLLGGVMEFIVGSVQYRGGGVAVAFPVIGICFFWLYKNGNITGTSWIKLLSIFFIAIASVKRTPIFVAPVIIGLLLIYVKGQVKLVKVLRYMPLVFLMFYIGVRTNVTLNPEWSTWGSFDLDYVKNYAIKKTFGVDNLTDLNSVEANVARGGSLFLILTPDRLNMNDFKTLLFGHGIGEVGSMKYGRLIGGGTTHGNYGIDHLGDVSEPVKLLYTLGYLGLIFYIFFAHAIFRIINNNRFKFVLISFFVIEYFLYYNTTLTNNAMSILFIFICLYSNMAIPKLASRQASKYALNQNPSMNTQGGFLSRRNNLVS